MPRRNGGLLIGFGGCSQETSNFLDGNCFANWFGRAKELGFLAGNVFIPLFAYHCCKGAIRMVQPGPPIQIFC